MKGKLHTYSPALFVVTFGVDQISGFADGTWIELVEMGDGTTSEAGADGEVARAMSTDPRVSCTFTLQQTSESNDVLNWYYQRDVDSHGLFPEPIMVKDLRGTTRFAGTGWVTKKADSAFSKSIETREWVIEGVGSFAVGGSGQ